jgi:hypothetical protein
MNVKVILNLLLLCCFALVQAKPKQQNFDKQVFYSTLESGKATNLDAQLSLVKKTVLPEKEAYEAVLLMKKAGMVAKPKDKLKLFKMGRAKLEAAITSDKDNMEYRFLRLIIQENAPKVLKYQNAIEEDSRLIRLNFKSLQQFLKDIITGYSKKSKFLKSLQP